MEQHEVFSKEKATCLPAHLPGDCAIDLLPNAIPPKGRVYTLSLPETKAMEDYIEEALTLGHIRPSTSPAAASFFFVGKKDGGLCPCINYQGLNAITICYPYPLPLVPAALQQLREAKYFTKLDLPLINEVFQDMLNRNVTAYIDDILIYSTSFDEHVRHIQAVLTCLQHHQLYVKLEKCEFHRTTIKFLGYVISQQELKMDLSKVHMVMEWPEPTTEKKTAEASLESGRQPLALILRTQQNSMSCDRVGKLLRLQQIDATTGVLKKPGTGSDLQVCESHSVTCCTSVVEERYQTAVHRDIQNLLQTFSFNLKLLITQNIAILQGAKLPVQKSGKFCWNLETLSRNYFFFKKIFFWVILVGRRAAAYGIAPTRLALLVSHASLAERTFLQAMHLAVEVINTTDHAQPSRDCRHALMRMRYCPLCQGLADSKPCMGYCLNVLRGCLAGLAEVDAHWQEFVRSLEALATRMHDGNELEHVLSSIPPLITEAVDFASRNAARLSSQGRSKLKVHGFCGEPMRSGHVQQGAGSPSDTVHLQIPERNTEESLSHRRREFVSSFRHYRAFYGGLADQMCVRELASTDGPTCWNGSGMVKSYTKRVVGSGIRAQAQNPEVLVKEADPIINQVIDKLKHINQGYAFNQASVSCFRLLPVRGRHSGPTGPHNNLAQRLQGRFIPKLGTLDQIEMGSGDTDLVFSGQCDDEDGCWGSGDRAAETRSIKTPEWVSRANHLSPPILIFCILNTCTH
ncbi:hypothetical protein QTP86_003211 [Hemibagrus guttatus]|nr:hypothetical protein QTP86_003211 [Hemibagrus guttatus]